MMCIITKNVSCCRELYVSQGFPVISTLDRLHFLEEFLLSCGTCWWNIPTLSYEQRRCHSSITSDWWTSYVYELSVTGWTASSRHFYCFRREMFLLQRLLMEHFSSSVHHLPHFQPVRWTFIISSLVLTMKTSASRLLLKLCIVIDNIRVDSEKLCNSVNCNSRLVMILLLWQPIVICDYPPIPQNVTTFYLLQRTDVFFSPIPTPLVYSTTSIPYRNYY